jgi:hypothetical protein
MLQKQGIIELSSKRLINDETKVSKDERTVVAYGNYHQDRNQGNRDYHHQ